MKNFKIVLLWIGTIVVCIALYTFGKSTYYCYQNSDGVLFTYKGYRGETTVKMWNLYDRETCNYVGTRKIFDKQPNARRSVILIILGVSAFSTSRIYRNSKKEKKFPSPLPSFNQS